MKVIAAWNTVWGVLGLVWLVIMLGWGPVPIIKANWLIYETALRSQEAKEDIDADFEGVDAPPLLTPNRRNDGY